MKLTNAKRDAFVSKVMNSIPRVSKYNGEWLSKEIQKAGDALLPNDVQAFIKNYPEYFNRESVYLGSKSIYTYLARGQRLQDINTKPLWDKYAEYEAEINKRVALRNRVAEVTYACSTLKALQTALPDLIEFMPVEGATVKNLPVAQTSLTQDLLSAGLKVKK